MRLPVPETGGGKRLKFNFRLQDWTSPKRIVWPNTGVPGRDNLPRPWNLPALDEIKPTTPENQLRLGADRSAFRRFPLGPLDASMYAGERGLPTTRRAGTTLPGAEAAKISGIGTMTPGEYSRSLTYTGPRETKGYVKPYISAGQMRLPSPTTTGGSGGSIGTTGINTLPAPGQGLSGKLPFRIIFDSRMGTGVGAQGGKLPYTGVNPF